MCKATVLDPHGIFKEIETETKEAAELINGLAGPNMSWTAYNDLIDQVILLDNKVKLLKNELTREY